MIFAWFQRFKINKFDLPKSTPSNYAHAITFKEAEWEYFYTMHEEVAQRLMKLVNLGLKAIAWKWGYSIFNKLSSKQHLMKQVGGSTYRVVHYICSLSIMYHGCDNVCLVILLVSLG